MGVVRGVIAAALCVAMPMPAGAQGIDTWRPYMVDASSRYGIPVAWIERVMRAESAGRTHLNGRPVVSRAGAMGLMQLMPSTWRSVRTVLGLGADAFDPHDNILAGTYYLRMMYDEFGYPGLFAAYNAGPARYRAALAGRALPAETIGYVAGITGRVAVTPRPMWTMAMSGKSDGLWSSSSDGLFAIPPRP